MIEADVLSAATIFIVFSCRIFLPPLWFYYVPLISPVYGQPAHWTGLRRQCIVAHVFFGIVSLALALFQFDKTKRPHWSTGYAYYFAGFATILTLRPLQETVGRGPSDSASRPLRVFVDVSSATWVASTTAAIVLARYKLYKAHRRATIWSLASLCVPLFQRLSEWFVCTPFAIAHKLARDALDGIAPWESTWLSTNARVLTFEGYGMAEHLGFPASAWVGLALACSFGMFARPDVISDLKGLRAARAMKSFVLGYSRQVEELYLAVRHAATRRFEAVKTSPFKAPYYVVEATFVLVASLGMGLASILFFIASLLFMVYLFEFAPGLCISLPIFFSREFLQVMT